jgi:hypothetical protein
MPQIDHIIYAAPDLDDAVDDIETLLGVRAAGGGQHPGRGTHNRLLGLGPRTYLEIIAPDPRQAVPGPLPYGVDGVTSGQLVGWALTTDDIGHAVAVSRAMGFDPGDIIEGQRLTVSGEMLRWRVTGNALAAGVIPFLIEWGATPHPASSAPPGLVLGSLQVEHPDPVAISGPLRALGAHVEVQRAPRAALVARIHGPNGTVELR